MFNFDLAKWWGKKDNDNKVWFLYKSLAILAITVGYIAGDGAIRYTAMGVIVLLLLHLVIWPFFTETTSTTTKIIVGGFLVFCVFGFLFPNLTDRVVSSTKNWGSNIDKSYIGQSDVMKTTGKIPLQKVPIEPPLQTLYLVPGENFRSPVIPNGTSIIDNINADCPLNCIVQVDHDSDQICTENGSGDYETDRHGKKWLLGKYQGSKCMFTIVSGGGGVIRYRERFLLKKSKVDFPTNLINVIYSFGTNSDLGPVVAKVRVATR